MLYGIAITLWLLMHDDPTLLYWTNIVSRKSTVAGTAMQWLANIPVLVWFTVTAGILLLVPKSKEIGLTEQIVFLLFLYLLKYTSLITGFVLYFTGWHSMNALNHIRENVFEKRAIGTLLYKALLPTLGAVLMLILIVWLGQGAWLQHNGLPALFVLLSVLTLPHMTEMHRLYIKNKG